VIWFRVIVAAASGGWWDGDEITAHAPKKGRLDVLQKARPIEPTTGYPMPVIRRGRFFLAARGQVEGGDGLIGRDAAKIARFTRHAALFILAAATLSIIVCINDSPTPPRRGDELPANLCGRVRAAHS
jgi:hypothetical protein